jgi:hypothetical protein
LVPDGEGTKADAQALREQIAGVLAGMGLRLSEEKTLITHIGEGLDFLGWRIQRHRSTSQKTGLVESPLLSNGHGGFGKRPGETDQPKGWHRASGRLRGICPAGHQHMIDD